MGAEVQAPPPAAFLGSEAEEAAVDRRLRAVEQAEGQRSRRRRWTGRAGWAIAAVAIGANFAQSFVTASLFPLKEIRHQFTVLREDGTSQVLRSTWDLPADKSEQLIQATAVKYAQRCESWSWVHAQAEYDFCLGLSAASRRLQYAETMDPTKNRRAPQTIYGQRGVVRIIPTGASRIGPNSIRVLYLRAEQAPDTPPVVTRHVATVDYAPIQELPANLRLMEPVADILVVRFQIDLDSSPLDLNPALAPQGNRR